MLVILDGFGYSLQTYGNAIAHAQMPTWHFLLKNYPNTLLVAAGEAVGLPEGFIGNSEVGHLTIGAGRIIPSSLKQINDAIDDGSFYKNPVITDAFERLKSSGRALHLIGLLSDGGVHSHEKHLYALLKIAHDSGLKKVFIHPLLDGRDVVPQTAALYLERLENVCASFGCGAIATLHGRFYAMDRDNNWDRTQASYDALVGKVQQVSISWQEYLSQNYAQGISEEFMQPIVLDQEGIIRSQDGVFFFNIRPDRARQLTQLFINSASLNCAFFMTMVRYKKEFTNIVVYETPLIENTLLDRIAEKTEGKESIFIIAETEKYAHVTYFFRGMRDIQLNHEQRVLIPSLKIQSFAEYPEMSAAQITQKLINSLQTDPAFFYLVNYANADMVGHSGNFEATVEACECLDMQLKILYEEVVCKQGGTLFIVADHGNAEEKRDLQTGKPLTAHTHNKVPFVVVGKKYHDKTIFADQKTAGLSVVASFILRHLFE